MYLLRTAPCTSSPELPLYDAILRDSQFVTYNVELNDERWNQASLPVRWGGLGVCSVVLLAPSVYLASAASTAECTTTLLPARLRDTKDSGIDAALSDWSRQATSPATPSVMPVPPCLQYNAHGMTSAARCRQTLYSMQP